MKHRISLPCTGCNIEYVDREARTIQEALDHACRIDRWDFVGDDGRLVCRDCYIEFIEAKETGSPLTDDSSDVW